MKIRTILVGGVVAGIIVGFCFGQDAPQNHRSDSTQLLTAPRSNDPHARVGAVEQIRSDSAMLQDPNVQSALLDLLDLETRECNERVREGERRRAEHRADNPDNIDDDAMYMNDLLETITFTINPMFSGDGEKDADPLTGEILTPTRTRHAVPLT